MEKPDLHFVARVGTTSIGVLYASLIASSLLVGPTVVDRLRAKRTLYAAWSANAVFAVANAFPRWETLVPASALVGFTMASCNIVYGLYVTALADQLNAADDDDDGPRPINAASAYRPAIGPKSPIQTREIASLFLTI